MKGKKTSVINSVTPCPKDKSVILKNVKNVVDEGIIKKKQKRNVM